jgi:hypothetical protein
MLCIRKGVALLKNLFFSMKAQEHLSWSCNIYVMNEFDMSYNWVGIFDNFDNEFFKNI